MRKFYILIALVSALLSGCVDGEDGDAYLAFYWIGLPMSYADNNPGVPGTIFLLEEYLVNPGTYSFAYTAWDSSTWAGTYTITEEEGDLGIFPLIPGEDGEDSHFELWLFSIGPSFWEYSLDLETAAVQSYGVEASSVTNLKKDGYSEADLTSTNEETVITQTKGRYTFTVRYKKL